MVYDDSRWVPRLKAMGMWNEAEARARVEDARRARAESLKGKTLDSKKHGPGPPPDQANGDLLGGGGGDSGSPTHTANIPSHQRSRASKGSISQRQLEGLSNGFDNISLMPNGGAQKTSISSATSLAPLHAFDRVRSIRGGARQEFGKIYRLLAPFYNDLVQSRDHTQPLVFQRFADPLQQAKMLAQLRTVAKSDWLQGSQQREDTLESMSATFENAALREFEQGYTVSDIDERMKKYAHVLVELNGGAACIDHYIHNHWLMTRKHNFGNSLDCLYEAIPPDITLTPSFDFFKRLSHALNNEAQIIARVFPASADVMSPFLDRMGEEVISDYVTSLFDEAHKGNLESYLKVVPGVYEQALHFTVSLKPVARILNSEKDFVNVARQAIHHSFEPHIDLYLREELDSFTAKSRGEVDRWEKQLSEQEASNESFLMSNVNRRAAKQDFLTSFKKVLMMPVNVLPSMTSTNKASNSTNNSESLTNPSDLDDLRKSTPSPSSTNRRSLTPLPEPPTTELAAKAAIMNSKLEGIGSLFSIEVALTLVHAAKSSIERAAQFVHLGGKLGEEAREECETVFVQLLQILGHRHIKPGFDKAVGHLSHYKVRETTERGIQSQNGPASAAAAAAAASGGGVKPLVTFLELVNVGDLIQQMVDAFYAQELVAPKLTDRDDFLNVATKEKKKFEQMLDERVAAGLNKGIDVLMGEVEYLCATTQSPADYNPPPSSAAPFHSKNSSKSDLSPISPRSPRSSPAPTSTPYTAPPPILETSPTPTASAIIHLLSSHTSMLTAATEKSMLDVFNQEVGLRLFTALCKHIKRQRVSVDGSIRLIADLNCYYEYVRDGLRNRELLRYFGALREVGMIFMVDAGGAERGGRAPSNSISNGNSTPGTERRLEGIGRGHPIPENGDLSAFDPSLRNNKCSSRNAKTRLSMTTTSNSSAEEGKRGKAIAGLISDADRYQGIFRVEEVYEFAERRADWLGVKRDVERRLYGIGCGVM